MDPAVSQHAALFCFAPQPSAFDVVYRMETGSEGGAEYRVTFEDVTNPGDVTLLATYAEGLTGDGATVSAREVRNESDKMNEF